ncbi:MAG: ATPase domain-containing protein [Candidatus Bathyarchaeia archaeon]
MMQIDWVKTGIDGLDRLLQGGFIKGSSSVIVGPIGTLKSFIGYQFIYEGLKRGEHCLCINTYQNIDTLIFQLNSNFGWNVKTYVDRGMLDFVYYPAYMDELTVQSTTGIIRKLVSEVFDKMEKGVTRVLICNLSQFFTVINDERLVLDAVYRLKAKAKESCSVILYILDSGVQDKKAEENVKSICDYVLETRENRMLREIRVVRGLLKHDLEWSRLRLTDEGVEVDVRTM